MRVRVSKTHVGSTRLARIKSRSRVNPRSGGRPSFETPPSAAPQDEGGWRSRTYSIIKKLIRQRYAAPCLVRARGVARILVISFPLEDEGDGAPKRREPEFLTSGLPGERSGRPGCEPGRGRNLRGSAPRLSARHAAFRLSPSTAVGPAGSLLSREATRGPPECVVACHARGYRIPPHPHDASRSAPLGGRNGNNL